MAKPTQQYVIFYRKSNDTVILDRCFYLAGSPREAVAAFEANTPKATWTEIFSLVPELVNEYVREA